MRKNLLALFLALTCLCSGLAAEATEATEEPDASDEATQTITFPDVEGTQWETFVSWGVGLGITNGKKGEYNGVTATIFAPDEQCKRWHIIVFLWRANGSPAPTIENPYADVPEEDSGKDYYKAALWAYEQRVFLGHSLNDSLDFEKDKSCQRCEAVTYLYRLADDRLTQEEISFSDVSPQDDFYNAVSWAVAKGIVGGYSDGTFKPGNICTRAHIMKFLYTVNNLG